MNYFKDFEHAASIVCNLLMWGATTILIILLLNLFVRLI